MDIDSTGGVGPVYNDTATTYRVLDTLKIVARTKDSLKISWDVSQRLVQHVNGFKVIYQAFGSRIKQRSGYLLPDMPHYSIEMLHESTRYSICVDTFTDAHPDDDHHRQCMTASTSVDSLAVALGSTLGAFLVLAIIVLMVFIAKWQHSRRHVDIEKCHTDQLAEESYDDSQMGEIEDEEEDDDDDGEDDNDIELSNIGHSSYSSRRTSSSQRSSAASNYVRRQSDPSRQPTPSDIEQYDAARRLSGGAGSSSGVDGGGGGSTTLIDLKLAPPLDDDRPTSGMKVNWSCNW